MLGETTDGSEPKTVDGSEQMAEGRGTRSLCPLQPAVCCLPSSVVCRPPSRMGVLRERLSGAGL